jgi:beta-lactamase superfamily II metal-dependent hydrolase
MADYFEIDFLPVETKKSGDAIAIRYEQNGILRIHVVDGGFSETGEALVAHILKYFGNDAVVDSVVLTHPDGDHARGLRSVLEDLPVREIWMHRPWLYAAELLPRFARFQSANGLADALRKIYVNTAALEEIALEKGIPILAPFQGQVIGAFTVLAPSRTRYLELIADSEKTPEIREDTEQEASERTKSLVEMAFDRVINFVKTLWGDEKFSPNPTSSENEMSVVQYACIANQRIVLTGDAGREALVDAADFAPAAGLNLPGVDKFQVPHHGSRRNVTTELLDRWLGSRLSSPLPEGAGKFVAMISSALADVHHPRKAVERAFHHRGADVVATEGRCISFSQNAPRREGWSSVASRPYPDEQED